MMCTAIALALLGLFIFKRHHWRRHAYGYGGCGGGCGRRGRWHHHHHDHDHDRGGGPEDLLYRLNLTQEQEKVVRTEVRKVVDAVRGLRDERDQTRGDLARSVRGDGLDEVALGEMFARHDEKLEGLRNEVVGALGRVHAVLEPGQRERLADLIESGLRRGFGPYRV
ncbi:MAG TPA: periplasmic heavy metal sensor [Kofleriaceae bacterium]|nr:periplasmic heavy metal sensor [Kofleriaceae bacterium]